MSSVNLSAVLPATRKSGAGLAISDLASVTFLRDIGAGAVELATVAGPFGSNTLSYVDSQPAPGTNAYSFYVTDTTGVKGDVSAAVSVNNVVADPPVAGTLTASLVA